MYTLLPISPSALHTGFTACSPYISGVLHVMPPIVTQVTADWTLVIMECTQYSLPWRLSLKAFVDWWVFVLQQFPGGRLCAPQKLCWAWDTSENQHNCTNCSQFPAEWTLLSLLTTSRGGKDISWSPRWRWKEDTNSQIIPHSFGWKGL